MAKKKQAEAKPKEGPGKGVWDMYEVKDGKLSCKNKTSPKMGEGYFMAEHKDRRTCGASGYTEFKDKE